MLNIKSKTWLCGVQNPNWEPDWMGSTIPIQNSIVLDFLFHLKTLLCGLWEWWRADNLRVAGVQNFDYDFEQINNSMTMSLYKVDFDYLSKPYKNWDFEYLKNI